MGDNVVKTNFEEIQSIKHCEKSETSNVIKEKIAFERCSNLISTAQTCDDNLGGTFHDSFNQNDSSFDIPVCHDFYVFPSEEENTDQSKTERLNDNVEKVKMNNEKSVSEDEERLTLAYQEIEDLKKKCAEKDQKIQEISIEWEETKLELKELEQCAALNAFKNEEEIRRLRSQIKENSKSVSDKDRQSEKISDQNENRKKQTEINSLRTELNALRGDVEYITRELETRNRELQGLQERVARMITAKMNLQEFFQRKLIRLESIFANSSEKTKENAGLKEIRSLCFLLDRLYP